MNFRLVISVTMIFICSIGLLNCAQESRKDPSIRSNNTAAPPASDCTSDAQCEPTEECIEGSCIPQQSPEPEPSPFTVAFVSPDNRGAYRINETIDLKGSITSTNEETSSLIVQFSSSIDGMIETQFTPSTGEAVASTQLSEGNHTISLTVTNGEQSANATLYLTICAPLMTQDFNAALDTTLWSIYGDATHQLENGWLEMTNNAQNKQGKIFNSAQKISPGNLDAKFRIYTGPNDNTGGDGFAFFIVSADTPTELETILNCCGGFGSIFTTNLPECTLTEEDFLPLNTFAVEFDTFGNGSNCQNSNASVDPTCEDHIAITINGSAKPFQWEEEDFGQEPTGFWAPVGNIEDNTWHDIQVILNDTRAIVKLDDQTIIDANVPEFNFKGGYLGFTGGSGAATNYHRFDDLLIEQACVYTGP